MIHIASAFSGGQGDGTTAIHGDIGIHVERAGRADIDVLAGAAGGDGDAGDAIHRPDGEGSGVVDIDVTVGGRGRNGGDGGLKVGAVGDAGDGAKTEG